MTPTLVAYLSVAFVLAVTPGATTTVVIRQALAGGWRAGLTAAAGAALGSSTHATMAALGLVDAGLWHWSEIAGFIGAGICVLVAELKIRG